MAKLYVNTNISGEKIRRLFDNFKNTDKGNKTALDKTLNELAQEIVFNAKFLCPAQIDKEPQPDENGRLVMQQGSNLSFMLLDNGKGQRFLPAFSSNAELEKNDAAKRTYTVELSFDDYASLVLDREGIEGVVLNPFGDNFVMNRATISQWREKKQIAQNGHAQHVITANTPVEFSTPNPYPLQMSNKVCEEAKKLPVKRMWLRGIILEGSEGFLLVVEFEGDRNTVFGQLADAAKPFLGPKSLHIVALDEGFGAKATENVIPIYSKE